MAVRTHTSEEEEWARDPSWASQDLTPLAVLTGRQLGKWRVSPPSSDVIPAGRAMMGPAAWNWSKRTQEKAASSERQRCGPGGVPVAPGLPGVQLHEALTNVSA